jgi:trigger factor
MNILKEQTSELTASLHITLEKNDYEENVAHELKEYQKKASMPGFRPGKVPFGLVKKMYGKAVLADKVNKLVSDALNNYIVENNLAILGHPLANMEKTGTIDFDQNSDYHFHFDIGLAPEFELDLAKAGILEYPRIKADKETIDKALEDLQQRHGIHSQPEKVVEGVSLSCHIEEKNESGHAGDNGYSKDIKFDLKDLTEAYQKLIMGQPTGFSVDFSPAVAFADEDRATKIMDTKEGDQSLSATFTLTINELHLTEPAELNEEFFKTVFPSQDDLDESKFLELLTEDIEKQFERETDRYFLNKSVEALVEGHQIALPDEFLKKWIVDNSEGKITDEQIDVQYESYARTFRWQLIESKLTAAHNEINVTTADIRNFVKSYFFGGIAGLGEENEESSQRMDGIVDMILKNKDEERRIADQIAEQKLSAFFKANIPQVDKPMSKEEYFEMISKNNNI